MYIFISSPHGYVTVPGTCGSAYFGHGRSVSADGRGAGSFSAPTQPARHQMRRRGGACARRLRRLAVAAAVLCCCFARGSHGASLTNETITKVATRLQQSLASIASTGLLTSFSQQDAWASAPVKGRLAQIAQGAADATAVDTLDIPEISTALSKKASELLSPLFSQMKEMAEDFDDLVANSRGRAQQPQEGAAPQTPAAKCGVWPDEKGWLTEKTAFVYPEGAQRVGRRDTGEFCKLFPEIQEYFAALQDVPAVHLAQYVTAKGEYLVYNLRDTEPVHLPASLDPRTLSWYVEASQLPTDFLFVVSTPRSLKLSMGEKEAVALMEAVFSATLSLLSEDDNFQVIVQVYSVDVKAMKFLNSTQLNSTKP